MAGVKDLETFKRKISTCEFWEKRLSTMEKVSMLNLFLCLMVILPKPS